MDGVEVEHSRPLADLVKTRNERWSYREMEKRARLAGYAMSHSQLADYANDVVRKPPIGEQVDALAAALDVSVDVVLQAVFQQFYGYVPRELQRGSKVSKVAAAVPAGLSADDEDELARLVDAWVTSRQRNL